MGLLFSLHQSLPALHARPVPWTFLSSPPAPSPASGAQMLSGNPCVPWSLPPPCTCFWFSRASAEQTLSPFPLPPSDGCESGNVCTPVVEVSGEMAQTFLSCHCRLLSGVGVRWCPVSGSTSSDTLFPEAPALRLRVVSGRSVLSVPLWCWEHPSPPPKQGINLPFCSGHCSLPGVDAPGRVPGILVRAEGHPQSG